MAQRFAWGIDIGESAIKAVKLRRSGDTAIVQEFHTIACEAQPGTAGAGDREYRVRTALDELQHQADLKGAAVAVSLPGRDVFPRFIPLPPVEKKRIPEIVRYEARTQMPFPIEEVIWDYQPVTGMDVPGEEVEVAFFAIRKATAYSFLTNLRLARVVPDLMEITPLALYNFLAFDRKPEGGTVVIDVGAANTDLVIMDGERFWTRSVAISGNDISRSLQEKYQISFEEAENLKRKAASSKQADKIFGAMRPIVDDLIGEIQRSIGFYKAQARNVRIERVILLGNSFKLPQLIDYFRKNLDYEVEVLDRLNRARVSSGLDAEKFEAELPSFAVAMGLGLQALGLARVNIDLMPRDVVRERALRQKIPYAIAVLALLGLPPLVGYQSASREIARCEEESAPIEKAIKDDQDLLRLEDEAQQPGKLGEDLQTLASMGSGRNEWAEFFNDLNHGVNKSLGREPFRLNGIRELSSAELAGRSSGGDGLGHVGMRPGETAKADFLTIEVRFEKDTPFSGGEVDLLKGILEAQRPHVLKVEPRERAPADLSEHRGGPGGAPGTPGEAYIYWVTYRARAGAPKAPEAAPAPPKQPPKVAPKTTPKKPVKRTGKKDDLKKID